MKNILITGCSTGIGFCAAIELQKAGYHVIATVRNEADAIPLTQLGITTTLLELNDSNSIKMAFEFAKKQFNDQIDALFNNAAFGQPGAVEDLDRDVVRQQFETNVFGTQELTNLIIAQMRRQGFGRIVYNSSVLGFISMPYRGAYNASKYALEGLADTLRQELHDTHIFVSLIEPGPILSTFRSNAFAKYKQHIDRQNSPHAAIYKKMEQRLTKKRPAAPFTLPPEAVVKKLKHALESTHPKVRYYVTFPTYLFSFLKRVLPHKWLDWVLVKVSQDEHK